VWLDMREAAPGPQKPRSVLGKVVFREAGEYDLDVVAERLDPEAKDDLPLIDSLSRDDQLGSVYPAVPTPQARGYS